jgi:anti-sigma factor RsiW
VEHLSQEQLDAMVMGTASRDDEAVRRHLATCEACASRLAREAQLELDLYDAAASAATNVVTARARTAPARPWRVALPVAAALAAVTFATWSLMTREKAEVAPPRTATVGAPSAQPPGPTGPGDPGLGARELVPQDVCRCVTVEQSQGPPTDPGGSRLCSAP